jgi:transposase
VRLSPGGNRHTNNALWRIVLTRLGRHEPRPVACMNRRLAEGKTKPEIFRCLKRYVAGRPLTGVRCVPSVRANPLAQLSAELRSVGSGC